MRTLLGLLCLAVSVTGQITQNFDCRNDGCCDQHEFCKFWSGIGECQGNGRWMRDNCLISCNLCGVSPTASAATASNCVDRNELCPFWGRVGECQRNRRWMSDNCQISCNRCGRAGVESNQVLPQTSRPAVQRPTPTATAPRTRPTVASRPAAIPAPVAAPAAARPGSNLPEGCSFVQSKEDTSVRRTLSMDEVENSNENFGCVTTLNFAECSRNLCFHRKFRSMDGSCNNLQGSPMQGAAFTNYLRVLSPEYSDGVSRPAGSSRPSAREVARVLLRDAREFPFNNFNSLLFQWGQFLAHDVAKTTLLPNGCNSCSQVPGRCVPIPTFPQDVRFGPQRCIEVPRSSPVCGSGTAFPRQQMNENTGFVDGSQVYGSSDRDLLKLRNGFTAFLRTTFLNGRTFPPLDGENQIQAGDDRANVFVGLGAMHTLFLREHNRVATSLQRINPHWDAERLFQEARKIVGAEMQVITYTGFLPKILGNAFDQRIGTYTAYDPSANPTIASSFISAGFRFGHGMIQEFYTLADGFFQRIGSLPITGATFKTDHLLQQGIDSILRGLMSMPAKQPQRIANSVLDNMFGNTDLISTNIQRGRDNGLPSYNAWRQFCGMVRAQNFEQLANEIKFAGARDSLRNFYGHPDNIDLYVGAMLEDPQQGAIFGPTLACIVGDQFKRLRDGDRLWFENPGIFTTDQVTELKRASISRVLCDNGDFFQRAPQDGFIAANPQNAQSCTNIAGINLERWRE